MKNKHKTIEDIKEGSKDMSEENISKESGCSGSCSTCSSNCASKKPSKEELYIPANKFSKIKKVIGIVSGKGGVGKSFVTSYLAAAMAKQGYKTAVLDADVTGPSIPKAFGIYEKATADASGIIPAVSKNGVKVMSVNLLLDEEEIPVVWRGPVIAGTVKQFWSDVVWGEVDYMFVDMPPGTGDVPLTVFQSIPLDGIIIVTSPQKLVSMIVGKAVNMAKAMDIPILGIIENYSYVECGECGHKIEIFGKGNTEASAKKYGLNILAKLPMSERIAEAVDSGEVEELKGGYLDEVADYIGKNLKTDGAVKGKMKLAVATDEEGNVSGHFGKCKTFTVYDIVNGSLSGQNIITTPGDGHEGVVNVLKENSINTVICGGIGMDAMQALMAAGILLIPGMKGDVQVAAAAYLDGSVRV